MEHFITALHINHVRHLKNIEIQLSPKKRQHLILTGRNGSGKTSVFDALKWYLYLLPLGEVGLLSFSAYYPDFLTHLSNSLSSDLSNYTFDISSPHMANPVSDTDEKLSSWFGISVSFAGSPDDLKKQMLKGSFITACYGAVRNYRAENPPHIEKILLKDNYQMSEHPGQLFVKYLVGLKTKEALYRTSHQNGKAKKIEDWFKNLTETLRKIFSDDHLTLNFDIENLAFYISETGKEPFSFDTLSSGYAAILDIVTDLIIRMEKNHSGKFDIPGIVLIDEVDAHLHLSLQKDILPLLTGLFPRIQFIVTTHSPFVLGSAENTVIYDLEKKLRISGDEGLSNLTYSGIVEGYFESSELSQKLEEKYLRFQELSRKEKFSEDDFEELGTLESYLDEVPDYLASSVMADYQREKLELEQRLEADESYGEM